MKKLNAIIKGLNLFERAYHSTKHQIWVSILLLGIVTMIFAFLLWLAEGRINPDFGLGDALVWTFVKYVDDPADVATAPVTIFGQVVGTMVGILGMAFFAVPAGLIGSGLMDAMDEKKHEEELEEYHKRIHKAFRRASNKSLRSYLNTLPDKGGEALSKLNFVPQYIPVSRLQVRQGIDLKDVFEVCQKFPEFRLKNLAEAVSEEENPEDRFVVEHFPLNTSYGCCIDRASHVTIVCPTGFSDVGIGWFSYYLAKLGGFNYISKEIEIDPDELDSFYNMSPEPLYNKKKRAEYTHKDKEAQKIFNEKQKLRKDFLADIKKVTKKQDSWVIIMADHLKNSDNIVDFHFTDNLQDGTQPTVKDREKFRTLYEKFSATMKEELSLNSELGSKRYPLLKKNLAYRLQAEGVESNAFVLRPSSSLMNFNAKKLVIAFRMAQVISIVLDNEKGIDTDSAKDLATPAFGYVESKK